MKVIFYNVLVFFVLANVLYWAIPAVGTILRANAAAREARRPLPPNYAEADAGWARRHREELQRKNSLYKSFVGWQTTPMAGETINVEGRYFQRRTYNPATSDRKKVYFFGGSTMWGMGASDAGTIPSQFAALSGIHAENFGEVGWTAHQSLMQLIRLLQAGHRPDLVAFYDGVNDVHQKCRIELTAESHERERQFDTALRRSLIADSFSHYFAPVERVAQNIKRELVRAVAADEYDCHSNPDKAEAVAANLLSDWSLAKLLVEAHGGKFVALLQPVAYFSRTRLDHLDRWSLQPDKGRQYQAVYPLIRTKLAQSGEFHDLAAALDIDEYIYIDFCHLSPNGNRYVAQRIADIAAPLGFAQP
jgi:hypothetical protein